MISVPKPFIHSLIHSLFLPFFSFKLISFPLFRLRLLTVFIMSVFLRSSFVIPMIFDNILWLSGGPHLLRFLPSFLHVLIIRTHLALTPIRTVRILVPDSTHSVWKLAPSFFSFKFSSFYYLILFAFTLTINQLKSCKLCRNQIQCCPYPCSPPSQTLVLTISIPVYVLSTCMQTFLYS